MTAWHEQARQMRAAGEKLAVIAATLHRPITSVAFAVADEKARKRARKRSRLGYWLRKAKALNAVASSQSVSATGDARG